MAKLTLKLALILTLTWTLGGCLKDKATQKQSNRSAFTKQSAAATKADAGAGGLCQSFEHRDVTYNCTELQPCASSLAFEAACCTCDSSYCAATIACQVENTGSTGSIVSGVIMSSGEVFAKGQSLSQSAAQANQQGTQSSSLPKPEPKSDPRLAENQPVESCMKCHNDSDRNDYAGDGIHNPHPFGSADNILCSTCHGGNPEADKRKDAHVPPPPQIGDWRDIDPSNLNDEDDANDAFAEFNRRTLSGLDKLPDYQARGSNHTAIDYLQFLNPGDLRVVSKDRGCGIGTCHGTTHGKWVPTSPIATQTGFFSGVSFSVGIDNDLKKSDPLTDKICAIVDQTCGEYGYRAVENQSLVYSIGVVPKLLEYPVYFAWEDREEIFDNKDYTAEMMDKYALNEYNQLDTSTGPGLALQHYLFSSVDQACGDCHLGNAGANNRYADFRSSGCTSCHMQYALDGRSKSPDDNIRKDEPTDPDNIQNTDEMEKPHPEYHVLRSVFNPAIKAKSPHHEGISDYACAGCHQGSNRTVLQYWGVRLDQNQDLVNNTQYPTNPDKFVTTEDDERFFDDDVDNNTFNGRNFNQLILHEDYDGDGLDDTPADVHYEAGMGCIDCHGSRDLHNGTTGDPTSGALTTRRHQSVKVSCESCHGGIEGYAATKPCTTPEGVQGECVTDTMGNILDHVRVVPTATGSKLLLRSKLDGKEHCVPQTHDVVVDNGATCDGDPVFSPKASFAMGRADGNPKTGMGPVQNQAIPEGFSHSDNMTCSSCHSAWQNSCVGCHLKTQANDNDDQFFFSNITGERIVNQFTDALFTYQHVNVSALGVTTDGKINNGAFSMNMDLQVTDIDGEESKVFSFSDRNKLGANRLKDAAPGLMWSAYNHNHSIRGRVDVAGKKEGPRYCVNCHLNEDMNLDQEYQNFRTIMAAEDYEKCNFELLQKHIGENTGNELNSPYWVHMTAGLGSCLFLFDEDGCPVNPLDDNANRHYCPDGAPADNFDKKIKGPLYSVDQLVNPDGSERVSLIAPLESGKGRKLRDGALFPNLSGPLGSSLLEKLTDPVRGLILDSWLDADGKPQGKAEEKLNAK